MSNKVKVTINSVKAVNKATNEMRIDFNIGKKNIVLYNPCDNVSIYDAIEIYIRSLGKDFHRDYQKSYSQYNGDDEVIRPCDIDRITRELTRLDDYGREPFNPQIREYMLEITA